MLKEKKLKTKIIIAALSSLAITSLTVIMVVSFTARYQFHELSTTCLGMKLTGDIQSGKHYLSTYFGKLSYRDKTLVDQNDMPIYGNVDFVDTISSRLGVVATVFVKDNDDFRRIITNVKNKQGERVVGTKLGKSSAAYNPILQKKTYIGKAMILGAPYLAAYDPILDNKNEVIGILFLGIPLKEINNIVNLNFNSLLIVSSSISLVAAVIAAFSLYLIMKLLFSPINSMLAIFKDIAEGEGDLTKRLDVTTKDEIGELSTYFNIFVENLYKIILKISANANTLASSATELSAVSTQIAVTTEEMSTQTSTVASATEQATSNVNTISFAAEEMSSSVNSVATAIEEMSASARYQETVKLNSKLPQRRIFRL